MQIVNLELENPEIAERAPAHPGVLAAGSRDRSEPLPLLLRRALRRRMPDPHRRSPVSKKDFDGNVRGSAVAILKPICWARAVPKSAG